jgi:hypothetical protein
MALRDRHLLDNERGTRLWWVGVHGGAGETTLAGLFNGTAAAEHGWPLDPTGVTTRVVLVARTSFRGLVAAQAAMRERYEIHSEAVEVLGLVLVADAPGKPAKELEELQQLVQRSARHSWLVPWVEEWRIGVKPSPRNTPNEIKTLARDLNTVLASRNGKEAR